MPTTPGPAMKLRALSARQGDWAAATVLLAWGLPNVPWRWNLAGHVGTTWQIAGHLTITLATAAPMLWRRRFPVAIIVVEIGLLGLQLSLGGNATASLAAVAVASFGLGTYSKLRRFAFRVACVIAAIGLGFALSGYQRRATGLAFVVISAAILAGDAASARWAERSSLITTARLAERAELARDLHDVLAHQLSAIAVQAGAMRLATAVHNITPEREALATIEALSRDALIEVSQILGVLRHEPDSAPMSRPLPTLSDLGKLIDGARRDGTPLDLTVHGDIDAVDPTVGLCTYRILQESLTNVARHSPGARTAVEISIEHDEVDVSVVNEPAHDVTANATCPTRGKGLIGMQERAEHAGGRFAAGPTQSGGFAVTVRHMHRDGRATGRDELRHET